MQLTANEFAKLVRDLRCDMRPGERRKNPRAPTRSRVQVVPVLLDKRPPALLSMMVRDISRTGIGLVASAGLAEGQRLLVLLPKDRIETFVLLCETVRVTRMPGDTYVIGLRMMRRVPADQYARFLAGGGEAALALTQAA